MNSNDRSEDTSAGDFSELMLSDDQRRIVEHFGRFSAERLGVSPVPLRGFLWKAAREWQQRNRAGLETLATSSPEDRFRAVEEILQLFSARAISAFPEERHDAIRQALKDGLDGYREQYSRR